jgi:hypothetical protein
VALLALGGAFSLSDYVYDDAAVVFATCGACAVILAESATFAFYEAASDQSMVAPTLA